jgi:hypothetical protein
MHIEREMGLIINRKKFARIKRKFNLKTKTRRKNRLRMFVKINMNTIHFLIY